CQCHSEPGKTRGHSRFDEAVKLPNAAAVGDIAFAADDCDRGERGPGGWIDDGRGLQDKSGEWIRPGENGVGSGDGQVQMRHKGLNYGDCDDTVVAVHSVDQVFAKDDLPEEVRIGLMIGGEIVLGDLERSVKVGNVPHD